MSAGAVEDSCRSIPVAAAQMADLLHFRLGGGVLVNQSPKRVLHVVRAMDNGGVETWLMHVLRGADRRRVRMDFLVHTSDPSAYDAEIRERKSQILRCTAPLHSPGYAWR